MVFYAHGYPRFEAKMKNIVVTHLQKNRFYCIWEVVVAFGTSEMEAYLLRGANNHITISTYYIPFQDNFGIIFPKFEVPSINDGSHRGK